MAFQQWNGPAQHLNQMSFTVSREREDDDAGILIRWVRANIGKVPIERYEDSLFFLTGTCDDRIGPPLQPLVQYRFSVVVGPAQDVREFQRGVLVDLEFQPLAPPGIGTTDSLASSAA